MSDKLSDINKEIRQLISQLNPSYKIETIRVNISSSFMARARCKECGQGPSYYYNDRKYKLFHDIGKFLEASKLWKSWVKKFNYDWYLEMQPKYFSTLEDFRFRLEDRRYSPLLHRTRGSDVSRDENVIEMVSCDCGGTIWAFNNKSTKKRPEITNRKGRYGYPQKFEY